jgi:hypothetical protein
MTLGALGMRGLTGQLTLTSDGKALRVAFDQGAVVGAHSPLTSDAAVRMAMTANLITSSQVADITRRMATAPDRDEIELLAELARLTPEQAARLRRRLVAQRAARTFSFDRGEFLVEDQVTISVVAGSELDIRAIVFLGAKNNLSEARLAGELEMLGGWFRLKENAIGDLAQYGFTAAEKPALEMLVEGANLADIEAAHPELGERSIRAVTYALASCGACEMRAATASRQAASAAPPVASRTSTGSRATQLPSPPRTSTGSQPGVPRPQPIEHAASGGTRVPQPVGQTGSSGSTRAPESPAVGRPRRASIPPPGSENWVPSSKSPTIPPVAAPAPLRMNQPTSAPSPSPSPVVPARPARAAAPPRRAKRNSAAIAEIEQLLAEKVPLLDAGADHFTLFGLSRTASADDIRNAYFTLARKLHPDRLSAIGVADDARNAQRLMAQVNAAFAVLNDAAKRDEYLSILSRGGEAAVKAEDARADEMAMRVLRAEEVFRQGEMALRREQLAQAIEAFKEAVELQPNESEYQAMLAWAQFAAAADKNAVGNATRRALTKE